MTAAQVAETVRVAYDPAASALLDRARAHQATQLAGHPAPLVPWQDAGPVAQVAFSISDAQGAVVRGPALAAVSAGAASATLPAPAAGTGYRLRVQATGEPAVAATSPAFSVTLPFGLLLQAGGGLLLETGDRILI